jgi:hypothetical protein
MHVKSQYPSAHRRFAGIYRQTKIHFTYSQLDCRPDDRNRLWKELSQSNYVPHELATAYLKDVSKIRRWHTPNFTLDLWIPEDVPAGAPAATRPNFRPRVSAWLHRLETLRRFYNTKKSIQFVCVPMPIPREFPKQSTQCLGRNHVNGGYTYIHQNTVYLFRAEELPKVLLHEYLHQIQGDKDGTWRQHTNALERIRRLVNIDPSVDIRPNEAVVEYWAWLYHQWFVGLEYHMNPKRLWDAETDFVLYQAKRIYDHQRECQPPYWYEETHVFSYYILKAFLVWAANPSAPDADTGAESLFYSIDPFVERVERQWETFRASVLEPAHPLAAKKQLVHKWAPNSARMTLLGDF